MNLLVTLDSNYLHQLMVMLKSIEYSNPDESLTVYVIHTKLTDEDFAILNENFPKVTFNSIIPDDNIFEGAHFTSRITKETYYRLLLCEYLPEEVEKILYLDPDIVVLKSLKQLYNHEFNGKCFVGAGHTGSVVELFNITRLNMSLKSTYINAGVMMINVKEFRKIIDLNQIRRLIDKKGKHLYQADQDIINSLYYKKTDYVPATVYNLDQHTYNKYRMTTDKVKKQTVIIHYDGKNKPWNEDYTGTLGEFYEFYERLLENDRKDKIKV